MVEIIKLNGLLWTNFEPHWTILFPLWSGLNYFKYTLVQAIEVKTPGRVGASKERKIFEADLTVIYYMKQHQGQFWIKISSGSNVSKNKSEWINWRILSII